MLTKKYYEMIASLIAHAPWTDDEYPTKRALCDDFAEFLSIDNPKFDRARFLMACGVAS